MGRLSTRGGSERLILPPLYFFCGLSARRGSTFRLEVVVRDVSGIGHSRAAGALRYVRSRMKLFLDPGSMVSLAAAITGNVSEVRAPITSRVPTRFRRWRNRN